MEASLTQQLQVALEGQLKGLLEVKSITLALSAALQSQTTTQPAAPLAQVAAVYASFLTEVETGIMISKF